MTDTQRTIARVQRVLPAPPAVVYDQWLDPEAMRHWMCPRPARPLDVALDPTPGGRLRFDIEQEGVAFAVTGRFLRLDRPRRLAFTWSCTTWEDPSHESVVTVTFEPDGDAQTLMTIEHELLPAGLAAQHEVGWMAIAGQLERAL